MKKYLLLVVLMLCASFAAAGPDEAWIANHVADTVVKQSVDGTQQVVIASSDFKYPVAIQPVASGNVWIADKMTGDLFNYLPTGERSFAFSHGVFRAPLALSANPATGGIWVIFSKHVVSLGADGMVLSYISGFTYPKSIASTPQGMAWVADTNKNRIVKLSAAAKEVAENRNFQSPNDISYNPLDGGAWVADAGQPAVVRINAEGDILYTFKSVIHPLQVATNLKDGGVWIADPDANAVIRVNAKGKEVFRVKLFRFPKDVSATPDGGVWVADSNNGQVVRLNSEGVEVFRSDDVYPTVLTLAADFAGQVIITEPEETVVTYEDVVPPGPTGDIVTPEPTPAVEPALEPATVEQALDTLVDDLGTAEETPAVEPAAEPAPAPAAPEDIVVDAPSVVVEDESVTDDVPEVTGAAVGESSSGMRWTSIIVVVAMLALLIYLSARFKKKS